MKAFLFTILLASTSQAGEQIDLQNFVLMHLQQTSKTLTQLEAQAPLPQGYNMTRMSTRVQAPFGIDFLPSFPEASLTLIPEVELWYER